MADNTQVKFGYGKLKTVLGKISDTKDGGLYFGYTDNGEGAVVANGKLVSSKILNIEKGAESVIGSNTSDGYKKNTITVTYVDSTQDNGTNTLTFDVVTPENVIKIAQAEAEAKVADANSSVGTIETFLKSDVISVASTDSKLSVTATADGATGYKTYTIDATKYNVSVGSADGSDNILKKYTIYQNGTSVGDIDIPKDYLVKSAELVTGTVTGDTYSSTGTTKYIKFVINTKDDDGTESTLYLNVNDLVDVYTGDTYITVGEDNKISLSIDAVKNAVEYVTKVVSAESNETLTNGIVDTSFIAPGVNTGNETDTTSSYNFADTSLWNTYTITQTAEGTNDTTSVEIKTLSQRALKGIYQAIEDDEKVIAEAISIINDKSFVQTVTGAQDTNSSYLTTITVTPSTISGTTGTIVTISDLLNKNYDTSVKSAISTAKSEVLGTSSDASTVNTVYGAKAYAKALSDACDTSVVTALTWVDLDA
jgi:hypothetical protein